MKEWLKEWGREQFRWCLIGESRYSRSRLGVEGMLHSVWTSEELNSGEKSGGRDLVIISVERNLEGLIVI